MPMNKNNFTCTFCLSTLNHYGNDKEEEDEEEEREDDGGEDSDSDIDKENSNLTEDDEVLYEAEDFDWKGYWLLLLL